MESATQSAPELVLSMKDAQNASGLLSSEAVLHILRLILAGAPLADVLTIIAQLVESPGDGTLCTIWLPHEDGKQLYCAAARSLPGFIAQVLLHIRFRDGVPTETKFVLGREMH